MASIRVDGWRSGIRFDSAHVIPHHAKCGRLHGHTYALHAEVHGEVDPETGFIMDFGTVKEVLRQVADRLDHHVLVQGKSPHFSVTESAEGVSFSIGPKRYVVPREDAEVLPVEATTAEAMCDWIADELLRAVAFPPNVARIDVGLDESYGKGAWASRTLR